MVGTVVSISEGPDHPALTLMWEMPPPAGWGNMALAAYPWPSCGTRVVAVSLDIGTGVRRAVRPARLTGEPTSD